MPRTKTTKPTTVSASVNSDAAVSVAPAPAVTVKKTKSSSKETVAVASVQNDVVDTNEVVPVVAEQVEQIDNLGDASIEFLAKLQQISSLISTLKTEYKTLEKKWSRELKASQKLCSKKKRKTGNRAPSGFVKPTKISNELATFLDKPIGSEMARTEVTRDINKYIRSNNLQDTTNGRKINADSKLAALLKLKKTDELTYFNLQRYMSPHFEKAIPASAAAPAAAPAATI
uniref:DM2 domain-containing protein n=1 Tax=viral metagenome TaxID=1070528 RepID=A0A6C0LMM0_9ZZZZ